jgi:hypothetical protein
MSIYDDVNTQLKQAMRARDKMRVAGLRGIRAAFIDEQKKKNGTDTVADDVCITILRRLAKQRRESIEAYRDGGRDDLRIAEESDLAIIDAFLPKLADEETTRAWVAEAVAATGAASMRDMGKVMGHLMKNHKADLDAKMANGIVKAALAG